MYIYQYRYDKNSVLSRNLALNTLVESLRKEKKICLVTAYRKSLENSLPGQENKYAGRLPVNLFAGTFKRKQNEANLREYSGLVLLEVDHLTPEEGIKIRSQSASMPQTVLSFIGSSGRSVKTIVKFTLPDGSLPKEEKKAIDFHTEAYRIAVKFYQPQLERNITLKPPSLIRECRMSYDPDLYFNPDAIAIRIQQPEVTIGKQEEEFCLVPAAPENYIDRLFPGLERNQQILKLFNVAFKEAIRTKKNGLEKDTGSGIMVDLAQNCFRSGLPEEEAVQCALLFRDWLGPESNIRDVFRIAYQLEKGFGENPAIPKALSLTLELEEFLNRRYIFRKNEMSGGIEFRDKSLLRFDFRPFTREVQHSICIEARKEGIDAWDKDIMRHVESEHIRSFHPIQHYLKYLPSWDGKDHIRALADKVPNTNPLWRDLFYRWMFSMVAHWLDMEHMHANSTTPLLVGGQGCGKSTFCLNILPPELRMYYTDSIDFSKRRDTELALHRYALINIDEFDMVKDSQQSYLKHILQKTVVNTRLPYKNTNSNLHRYATFIATSNNFDLLSDPTGSRRFLCVEVNGMIENDQPIFYEQLYAQILHALKNGERFWLTREEEKELSMHNLRFQQLCLEEELLFTYFHLPKKNEAGEYLLAAEIMTRIKKRLPSFKYSRSSVTQLGRILSKHKFPVKRLSKGNCYLIGENR